MQAHCQPNKILILLILIIKKHKYNQTRKEYRQIVKTLQSTISHLTYPGIFLTRGDNNIQTMVFRLKKMFQVWGRGPFLIGSTSSKPAKIVGGEFSKDPVL
jgi:uncharacterized alpha/beta hydrolase family protein